MDVVRSFIAIELDRDILNRLEDLQDRIRQDIPPKLVRWVRPEGIHLTLKFLGDVPAEQIDAIARAINKECAPHVPFAFSIGGLGCFPNPRRPRVVWVGVDEPSGTMIRLQRDIEQALKLLGFPPENRGFSPHLTLGRVKGRGREEIAALSEYISRAKVRVGEMQASSVHLMRSDLLPGGAVYTELAVAEFLGTA